MNDMNVKINFSKQECIIYGVKPIDNDYNSTRVVFNFEDNLEGRKVLEIRPKNSDTKEATFSDEIINNELILTRVDQEGKNHPVFTKAGTHILEVSLYGSDSKLSSVASEFEVLPEQVTIGDETAIVYLPVFDKLMQDLNTATNNANTATNRANEAATNANNAATATNNLNIDINKVDKTATIELTKKDGTTKSVNVNDGVSLQFMWQGTSLGIKTDDMENYVFVNLQGIQGIPGPQGEPFRIKKTYSSVAEMNADFDNMSYGDYVMIASTVEVEDNAKLYTRGESQWIFITDFSGATGIKGETGATPNIQIGTVTTGTTSSVTRTGTNENPILNFVLEKGETGQTGSTGPKGDTGFSPSASVTQLQNGALISITDETGTTTANIQNGEVTNKEFEYYKTISNVLPKVEDEDTEITLNNTGNAPLSIGLKGNTYQDSTNGYNLLSWTNVESVTQNGVTRTYVNPTTIKFEGTPTSSGDRIFGLNLPTLEENTIYTLVLDGIKNSNMYAILGSVGNISSKIKTFNSYNTTTRYFELRATDTVNKTLKLMLLKGSYDSSNLPDYEPYTNGASPNPDYPQDIHVVSGDNNVIVVNKNLFDKSTITTGRMINKNTGNPDVDAGTNCSNYIDVSKFTNVILSGATISYSNGGAFYDSNKEYVSGFSSTALKNGLTIPNNAVYLRFNTLPADTNTAQLEEGPTATDFVEHQEQVYPINLGNIELCKIGDYQDDIRKTTGKNLFDKDNANVLDNIFLGNSAIGIANGAKTLYIDCKPNTTYTISKIASQRFVVADTSQIPANTVSVNNRTAGTTKITITTSENANYLCVFYYLSSADTLTEEEIRNSIQIEEGSEATYWEPYGKKWIKYGAIGKLVLNGSEEWVKEKTGTENWLYALRYTTSFPINVNLLSNYYIKAQGISASNTTQGLSHIVGTTQWFIRIRYGAEDTLENYKNWLSTHNLIDYYPLAIPTITEITDSNLISQLDDIEYAMSYKEQTNISQENNDMPFVIPASAFKDLNAMFTEINNAIIELGGE